MEIKRDRYLQQLIESRHNGFIKVVTGIRRCGKSYLLNVLFYHYLLNDGVKEDHIIRVDLEDRMNKELRDPDVMLHYVHDRIKVKPIEPVSRTIPLLFYGHFKGSVNAQSSDMCHFRGR